MSGVIDKLETLFLKAEADLSYAHRKLDNEFHEKYSTYTTDEVKFIHLFIFQILLDDTKTNPLRVMRRIAQLKEDVALVSKRSQQILTEKEVKEVIRFTSLTFSLFI